MSATLTDFYNALKQAVMFSPQYVAPDSGNGKVWKCRQLQTFRVMAKDKGAELASANLGAVICDKGKPFFWSREWHENKYNPNNITFKYPALLLTELSFSSEQAFQQNTKRCYTFQLAVVDQLVDDCKTCSCESCEKRTINEIYADTEALLFSATYYLSKMREARLEPSNETVWANTDYLAHLKETGDISEFHTLADFGGLLNGQNKAGSGYRLEFAKIYGTALNITACFQNCEATEFNFNLPDFGVLAAEAGCKTCG